MKPKHFIELTGPESEQLPPLLASIRDEVEAELSKAQKDGDDGKAKAKVYYAIASTAALDRDDEVLIPKGVDVRHFETNPVMLHIHNYRQVPAGKVHRLDVSDEAVGMAYSFAEGTAAGDELKHLYDNDFMRAFSVGFIPRGIVRVDEQTPNKIDVDLRAVGLYDCRKTGELRAVVKGGFFMDEIHARAPDAAGELVELKDGDTYTVADAITEKDGEDPKDNPHKFSIDLAKYERRPRAIIAKWELLEISPVPIGSNPEALLQRCIGGLIRKYQGQPAKLAQAKLLAAQKLDDMIASLESVVKETEDLDIRNAVPPHTTPADLEAEWVPDAARASVARWASEDGTGNKEAMDWGKFSQGFAWFDGEATNSFSGYKLLHHEVDEEKGLIANFAGVRSAMATLLGDNVDVEGDALAVYEHLARHYRDVGAEVPAFERDYSDEELKAIEDGTFEPEDEKGPVASHTTPIDNEAAWNGPAARGTLRRWASSDGSGNPDTIDFARFARGFAWFDSENRETLGAYSLPHHVVRDGSLVAIWRGVTAAMGALLGARGGTNIPDGDRARVHAHLARHYRDNDREAPPLARDYTEAEIKAITLDLLQFEKGEDDELKAVEKDVAMTGTADGHAHRYDPGRNNGTTESDQDHEHDYHSGEALTGPGPNGHRHSIDWPGSRSLEELHEAQWEHVEERAVVTTGVVNGHSHSVDNMRTGQTSTVNGHAHPYTAGAARTGPGGSDNHVHPVPNAGASENTVSDEVVRELLATLAKRVEELEAEFSVRLGILHNMLEEMGENVLSAIESAERGAGSGTPAAPGKSDGDGSGGDGSTPSGESQNEAEEETLERGVLVLEDFLKAQNGNG